MRVVVDSQGCDGYVSVIIRSLKRVLSLRLHLEDQEEGLEPHLVFDMQCDYSIVKRHQFCVEDCEIVHAIFNRQGESSCLSGKTMGLSFG